MTEAMSGAEERQLRLRYDGTCRRCGTTLAARTSAWYDPAARTVRCIDCPVQSMPDRPVLDGPHDQVNAGTAGASARRVHDHRSAQRQERIKAAHPRLMRPILALPNDPQSTTAWATGAEGEERVGARLDRLASGTIRVLHDRRVPGSSANIDHLVVTPTGVHVIDSKKYTGRPERRAEGGLFRPRVERLFVGGRDRTSLVEGVLGQVKVVERALGDTFVEIKGYLCFVDADWPLLAPPFVVREVTVVWPRKLGKVFGTDGPLSPSRIDQLHRSLAGALPPA